MLPSHIITSCVVARLDIGHQSDSVRQVAVGAATFTAHAERGEVGFTLDTFVLQPSDQVSDLVTWLDRRLADPRATLAGYQLPVATALLARLPGANRSSALRNLTGCGHNEVLDLSARRIGHRALTFQEACERSQIACARRDPGERFMAWCRSDTDGIAHDLQVDAIATLRLIMRRIGEETLLGGRVATAINGRLAAWLHKTEIAAARLHRGDLGNVAG